MTFRAARLAVVLTAAAATLLIAGPAQAQTTVNIIANDDNQFVRIDPPGSAPGDAAPRQRLQGDAHARPAAR